MATSRGVLIPWKEAVNDHIAGEYQRAIEKLIGVKEYVGAKVIFNMSQAFYWDGLHDEALAALQECVETDEYLSIGYFLRGNILFEDQRGEALENYDTAYACMRGNDWIDYTQLGMEKQFFTCDVLFNRALCFIADGKHDKALTDITEALNRAPSDDRFTALQALKNLAQTQNTDISGWYPIQLEPDCIFKPDPKKLQNVATSKLNNAKNPRAQAKITEISDNKDGYIGFSGNKINKVVEKSRPISFARPKTFVKTDLNKELVDALANPESVEAANTAANSAPLQGVMASVPQSAAEDVMINAMPKDVAPAKEMMMKEKADASDPLYEDMERPAPAAAPRSLPPVDSRPRDEPRDERSRDERSRDERSRDERSRDERPRDERPRDERPRDERPRDERPMQRGDDYDRDYDRRQRDPRDFDDRSRMDNREFDDRSRMDPREYDDRSRMDPRDYDDRERRYNDRSLERDFEDRARLDDRGRDYDDRPRYDDRDRRPDDRRYDDRRYEDRRYEDRRYEDRRYEDRRYEDRRYEDRRDDRYEDRRTPYDDREEDDGQRRKYYDNRERQEDPEVERR